MIKEANSRTYVASSSIGKAWVIKSGICNIDAIFHVPIIVLFLNGKMDSFMTCPGLGTLPEIRRVVRKKLRAGPVVDDSRTSFALRKVASRQ